MFFVISKILYFLVMPLTIVCFCFLAGLIIKHPIYKKRLLVAGILLLLFFTNDFIINEIMLSWEIPPTPLNEISSNYDVAIILTGITNLEKPPHDRVYFNKGADRVMHTVQLYKQKKVKKILVTGGSGSLWGNEIKEADELKRILLLCEIPENDIFVEDLSRNTRENAAFSAVVLNNYFPGGKYLLVTSAFHLRRAHASFQKAGINTDIFSTDFYANPRKYTLQTLIIPNDIAIRKWSIFINELVGIMFYKLAGYI
ncbi:MAG: YdcF family protein [Bacteroidota bacterium]|nr:YdcF family protein [Bacteroidota bacterium]